MSPNLSYLHTKLTGQIIGIVYQVHERLGPGHRENVYEQALASALRKAGLQVCSQVRAPVCDDDGIIAVKIVDLVVNDCVAIEVKALSAGIRNEHREQLAAWLWCNGVIAVGLVVNFGSSVTLAREYEPASYDARNQGETR